MFEKEEESEFGCLNLDVTVPSDLGEWGDPLPVLVWIHGDYPHPNLLLQVEALKGMVGRWFSDYDIWEWCFKDMR